MYLYVVLNRTYSALFGKFNLVVFVSEIAGDFVVRSGVGVTIIAILFSPSVHLLTLLLLAIAVVVTDVLRRVAPRRPPC